MTIRQAGSHSFSDQTSSADTSPPVGSQGDPFRAEGELWCGKVYDHADHQINVDAAPTKSMAPLSNDKVKNVHEALGLAGTRTRGGQTGSPPKRARTGEDPSRIPEDRRGRLPVLAGRDHDRPPVPRITMKVKPVSLAINMPPDNVS